MRVKEVEFVQNMLKSCTSKFEDKLWEHQIGKAIYILEKERARLNQRNETVNIKYFETTHKATKESKDES